MGGTGNGLPRVVVIARFVVGTVALAVLSGLATLALWAVAYPAIRGWSPSAITSGSMSPAISVGDVLVAGPVDPDRLGPGAVVVFDDPSGPGLISHRLVEKLESGDYLTRGDANRLTDSTPVRPDQLRGIGRLVVPFVGRPHAWAEEGDTSALALTAAALLALLTASRWGMAVEFDPWAEPRTRRTSAAAGRLAPAAAGVAGLVIAVGTMVAAQPVTAAYADPSQSDASSITAAGTFP